MAIVPLSMALSIACADGATDVSADTDTDVAAEPADFVGAFDATGLVSPITEEACTLSSGLETTCWRVVLRGAPTDHEVGPFCPRSTDDGAAA
ncbi:MAG: hypothetical protein RLZZ383_2230, partial [Pseudomonadota bacterium]